MRRGQSTWKLLNPLPELRAAGPASPRLRSVPPYSPPVCGEKSSGFPVFANNHPWFLFFLSLGTVKESACLEFYSV